MGRVPSSAGRDRRRPELISDPDARWNGKGSGWFGYWLHGVVRVGEIDGPDTPCLTERIEVTAANADSRVAALGQLTRMVADREWADEAAGREHRPRRDILADRFCTSEVDCTDDWGWPVFALGFTSVHYLTEHQLGQAKNPLLNGAIVVDGQPYSPRLPRHLRNLTPPKVGAPKAAILAYQAQVAQRAPYALHAVGGRRDDGAWDFGCRAMQLLGALRCDLKPRSVAKPANAGRPTTDPTVFSARDAEDLRAAEVAGADDRAAVLAAAAARLRRLVGQGQPAQPGRGHLRQREERRQPEPDPWPVPRDGSGPGQPDDAVHRDGRQPAADADVHRPAGEGRRRGRAGRRRPHPGAAAAPPTAHAPPAPHRDAPEHRRAEAAAAGDDRAVARAGAPPGP